MSIKFSLGMTVRLARDPQQVGEIVRMHRMGPRRVLYVGVRWDGALEPISADVPASAVVPDRPIFASAIEDTHHEQ